MSKYNRFATELNSIATKAFYEYTEAKQTLEDAKQVMETTDPSNRIAVATAETALDEAKKAFNTAKSNLEAGQKTIQEVRKDLKKAVEKDYLSKAELIDTKAVELLRSGVMSPKDYEAMFDKAYDEQNHTMVRIIAHYAENDERLNEATEEGELLRQIVHASKNNNGHEYIEAFDSLCGVYERTVSNPLMIESWNDLTADLIEEF